MKDTKKRTIIISSMISAMFIAPLVVYALMYKSIPRINQFEPATANIQIEEKGTAADTQTQTYTLTTDINGNYAAEKSAKVGEINHPNGEYLRVRLVPMWYDEDGNICAGISSLSNFSSIRLNSDETALLFCQGEADSDVIITVHLAENWKNNWKHIENGCFESLSQVKAGEENQEILSKVEISGAVFNAAQSAGLTELRVDVIADAVQSVQSDATYINPRWTTTTATNP